MAPLLIPTASLPLLSQPSVGLDDVVDVNHSQGDYQITKPTKATKALPVSLSATYFKGFHRSLLFERYYHRLAYLERWSELAIRPSASEVDPEDLDMFALEEDEWRLLQQRCIQARTLMNEHLPPMQLSPGQWEQFLFPLTSTIPNAGLGLFYKPVDGTTVIPPGTVVCYYTGHLHSPSSARRLQNTSYLMMIPAPNLDTFLVDAAPLLHIKARYINDPLLQTQRLNCSFVPQPDFCRAAVVTIQPILPNQELFAAYGDAYWIANPL